MVALHKYLWSINDITTKMTKSFYGLTPSLTDWRPPTSDQLAKTYVQKPIKRRNKAIKRFVDIIFGKNVFLFKEKTEVSNYQDLLMPNKC